MCLVLFSFKSHPKYPLILAANRDEFFIRPTGEASFWEETPDLLAGKDLQAGGTWLGIRRSGRFACVTNYRDPSRHRDEAPSRGKVVSKFLQHDAPILRFLSFHGLFKDHNPFNLIAGSIENLSYFNNITGKTMALEPGTFGLSNAFLNSPWPKVQRGVDAFRTCINAYQEPSLPDIFRVMEDREIAPDLSLPDTGVGLAIERMLSPRFISTPDYGTRSSTIITADSNGQIHFVERRYDADASTPQETHFSWSLR